MLGEGLVLMLTLFTVKQIDLQPGEAVIVFVEGKTGRLPKAHKDYDYFLRLAQRSLERQHPVAASLDAQGQISDMARADNDVPARVADHDAERMKVAFEGHDGTYFLRKDHPKLKRLGDILRAAIKAKARVWFVAEKPSLVLVDVAKAK